MKTEKIDIEICQEDDAIIVPFDQNQGEKYQFKLHPDQGKDSDGIVLSLNKASCLAFAKIFGQLALGSHHEGFHLHLGYNDKSPNSRGVRIELKE